jgi:hypothetical protein
MSGLKTVKRSLVTGALAGLCGGIGMKALVYKFDPDSFGLSARTDAKTARAIWRRMCWGELEERRAEIIGALVHYGFAMAAGAAYAAAAERFPVARAGRGTLFGAALWLVGDEWAVSASGLEEPGRTPLRSHLSALGAHLVYGIAVEALRAGTVSYSIA